MKFRIYLVLSPVFELLIRILCYLLAPIFPAYRFELERRLRGGLYGCIHGSRGVSFDRGVLLEGLKFSISSKVKMYRNVQIITGVDGDFTIGSGSHIARNSIVSAIGGVEIGEKCNISSGVRIYSVSNKPDGSIERKRVRIGDNVLVGSGAYIGPGVTIGNNSAIGSGAVVVKDVPEGTVVVGVPARELPGS